MMSFLKDLNPVQQEAVKAANGPVMIIAGAGSGKTRVLTYRIAYLLECGVPPYQILALTFTNKAANEMKERIKKLVGEKANELWMGTFHSMFARVLRRECEPLGYTRSFTIYDSDDSHSVVKKSAADLNISLQQFPPSMIQSRISGAKNQLISPQQYEKLARDLVDEKVAKVYAAYQRTLERSNAMDFDDLLVKPIELFQRNPAVLEKYQNRFKFTLVDEFQDTNRAQYEVTKLLSQKHKNICVVGDDAQSIYSFRGADIRNILDFAKDYKDCQTFRLEQNYRSTKTILAAADKLIKYNANQLEKDLWTENPKGEAVTLVECTDDKDEGYQIVHAIQEESLHKKLDLKDFAVLYRTNAQSRSVEDALRRGGIPYVIVGGIRFYERKEIKDVLAYLRLLANPNDEESLLRVINYPARGVGETTIERLREFARLQHISLYNALALVNQIKDIADRMKKGMTEFRALIEKYGKLRAQMSLSELARSLVDELGILRMYKEEATSESLARWENVQELLSAISEFSNDREGQSDEAGRAGATLESFLEEVALVSDIDQWEGTRNVVTLMTLHASKGLEFPVVFVAGLEEGLLPFYSAEISGTDLEEERRLLYVGMTRAQQKLYLSHTKLRYRYGEPSFPMQSRFLTEIGTNGIKRRESLSPRRAVDTATIGLERSKRTRAKQRQTNGDGYFADDLHDYENESQEAVVIKAGTRVQHEIFGEGKVVQVTGKGDARKATVHFDDYGVKNLILKFAKLKPA
ncbi:MAG: UvrD-helicase domain-containing protein [Ignavibacteriae bacterium]|nr:UvrD-helicase domain-containing protein [Ignavibacteriota bacterium]